MKLHVEERGDAGSVIVLSHGLAGSARNFGPQVRALSPHHRLITFDARGHGRSEAPLEAEAYRPECFVADLASLVEGSGVERVIVGGLSMGAGITLRYALAHPERVSGIVLASFPRGSDDERHQRWALGFADAIDARGLESAGEEFVWGASSNFDEKGAALVRAGFLEHPPHALSHTLRELIAAQPPIASLADELAKIAVPTLVVAGGEDHRSLPQSQALAAAIPDAELVVIEGGGHVVNLTSPTEFNRVLEAFLARADAR